MGEARVAPYYGPSKSGLVTTPQRGLSCIATTAGSAQDRDEILVQSEPTARARASLAGLSVCGTKYHVVVLGSNFVWHSVVVRFRSPKGNRPAFLRDGLPAHQGMQRCYASPRRFPCQIAHHWERSTCRRLRHLRRQIAHHWKCSTRNCRQYPPSRACGSRRKGWKARSRRCHRPRKRRR